MKSVSAWLAAAALAGILGYGGATARMIQRPLVLDETLFPVEGRQAAYFGSSIDHNPPMLNGLVRAVLGVTGWGDGRLRWIGIACFLLTLWLVWSLGERWEPGSGLPAATAVLWHPLAVNSSWTLDYDQTLMVPLVTAWCLVLAMRPHAERWSDAWWAGGAMALALWAKMTTPLVMPPALFLAHGFRGQWRTGRLAAVRIAAIGGGLFALAWFAYSWSHGLPVWALVHGRLMEVLLRGPSHYTLSAAQEIAERVVRVTLWIGPWFACWVAWACAMHWMQPAARRRVSEDVSWLFCALAGTGYLVVGGVLWSFAKYHAPLVPVLSALAAAVTVRVWRQSQPALRRTSAPVLALAAGGAALWRAGDVLYAVNRTLRMTWIYEPAGVQAVLWGIAGQGGWLLFGGLLVAAGVCWCLRATGRAGRPALLGTALLAAAGMSHAVVLARQAGAAYATTYCYGRPWTHYQSMIDAAKMFGAKHPHGRIMAPFDVLYNAGLSWDTHLWEWKINQDAATFLRAIQEPDVVALMVDPYFSNTHFLTVLLKDEDVAAVMRRLYEARPLGEGTLWIRHGAAPAS